jgi:hypothetical protein
MGGDNYNKAASFEEMAAQESVEVNEEVTPIEVPEVEQTEVTE